MIRLAAIAALLSACTTDAQEPVRYSCAVLYECEGDRDPRAFTALPCAADVDEANDLAINLGMSEMGARCGDKAWTYVRSICEVQAPASACEVQP